jgi:hypothetical protein
MEEKLPSGFVEIEVEIDDKGDFKRKILRHGEGDSCKTQKDDKLLNDLFSSLGDIDDHGRTDEYYETSTYTEEPQKHVESKKKSTQENRDLNAL